MHELKAARVQALTTREMAQIGLFTALIAAGAYIKVNIPVQPFPMHFTMQFLFVLLAGFLLGAKKGAICVGIYLAVGLSGIPVFAAGGGPAYLIRPTFGFLLGFVFAAWITGKLSSLRLGAGTAWDLFSAFWGMMAYFFAWAGLPHRIKTMGRSCSFNTRMAASVNCSQPISWWEFA